MDARCGWTLCSKAKKTLWSHCLLPTTTPVDGSPEHSEPLHWDHLMSWQAWYQFGISFSNYRKDMGLDPIRSAKITPSGTTWLRAGSFQRNLHLEVSPYWPELLKSALAPSMRNANRVIEFSILSWSASLPSFLIPRKETPKPFISELKTPWRKSYAKLDLIGTASLYTLTAQ